ncbi:hypothetical protein D3C84_924290 [compost metagenome]
MVDDFCKIGFKPPSREARIVLINRNIGLDIMVDNTNERIIKSSVPMPADMNITVRRNEMPSVMALTGVRIRNIHPVTSDW